MFLDPFSLDPSRYAARVTREVAGHLAELARALEDTGNPPEKVAAFLMRCIFTMFAEDVDLLQGKAFTRALEERWLLRPSTFKTEIEALWQAMKDGTNFGFERLLRFNGGLFADPYGLNLTKKHLEMLVEASRCDWADVEPAIFGTLVERALDPWRR